jgi:hypothetical protein
VIRWLQQDAIRDVLLLTGVGCVIGAIAQLNVIAAMGSFGLVCIAISALLTRAR